MKKLGLIGLMFLLLAPCLAVATGKAEQPAVAGTSEADALLAEPTTLSLFIPENASWPFRDDWYILDLIKRKTNISFDVNVAATNYAEKMSLVIASRDLPDILWSNAKDSIRYGQEGAFVNILEHENKLPNFAQWRKGEYRSRMPAFISSEGKMYIFPVLEIGETEREGWFYRKDIFEKNGLKEPADDKEFYQILKKLKQVYPDSYPFTFRSALYRLGLMAPQFGARFDYYYDKPSGTWKYGAIEDNMKEMVTYFNKLYEEELLTPDFLSISTKAWVDQISADKAFITFDWLTRIDFYNIPLREQNPDFTMYFMPPWKGGLQGQRKIEDTRFVASGGVIGSTTKKLDAVLAYFNWLYSDEGRDLISWGEEGVTYKVVDGKNKFLTVTEPNALWRELGMMTQGFYGRFDVQANISLCSPEVAHGFTIGHNYDMEPRININFSPEDQEIDSITGQAIKSYKEEQLSKFIIGERPLGEWDQYVQQIKKLGLDKMLGLYDAAYKRLQKIIE